MISPTLAGAARAADAYADAPGNPDSPVQLANAALSAARELAYAIANLHERALGGSFAYKEAMADAPEPEGSLVTLSHNAAHTRHVLEQAFDTLRALESAVRDRN